MQRIKFPFTVFFFLTYFLTAAQNSTVDTSDISDREYVIQWQGIKSINLSDTEKQTFLSFEGALYDFSTGLLPLYYNRISLPFSDIELKVELQNTVFVPLEADEAMLVSDNQIIKEDIQVITKILNEDRNYFATLSFVPLRKNSHTGQIEKLIAFNLSQTYDFVQKGGAVPKSYAQTSVLASGNIYKLCVSGGGIHKISYDDLVAMGINAGSINPQHIRIYGNGGGMLPESNDDFRHDDLVENAIFVFGENDGVFNTTDYILFFAESPHERIFDTTTTLFSHQLHHYTDKTCYFLTADHGQGKRIQQQPSLTTAPTHTANSFHDYAYHEKDLENLIHSGKEWFGESFDIQTEYTFPFTFTNIKTGSKIHLRTNVAARSFQNSTFNVNAGGNQLNILVASVPTSYTSSYARMSSDTISFTASGQSLNVTVKYNKPTNNSKGWLNNLQFNFERNLIFSGSQMAFRNTEVIGAGNITEYIMGNANSAVTIWEITDPLNITHVQHELNGNQLRFVLGSDSLRQFIAHDASSYPAPDFLGKIPNQNLHGLGQYDMLIVTHPLFLDEAQRLALEHYNVQDLSVAVVVTEQVYNEFSSGVPDATAIRDFAKMFFDRATNEDEKPKYLLLFGDGSYDNKNRVSNNTNFIPTYQSLNSLEPTSSYVTDDFYGLLTSGEGLNSEGTLDIGVGRYVVQTVEEARNAVNKTVIYLAQKNLKTINEGCTDFTGSISNYGDWRNSICFVADDEDGNLHISQAEYLANMVDTIDRNYNIDKIYFDSYLQETNAGGQRYPEVNDAINNRVQKGALIINYTGHGGELGWGHERVLEISDINSWQNKYNMPAFVTATCEFSRFDDPNRISAGEHVFLNPNGGGIALFSTTRLAFANTNFALNKSFYSYVFEKVSNEYPSLGDLMKLSKNSIGNISSIRNFVLFGDPALKLAYPEFNILTTSCPDTMKALSKVVIQGYVTDLNGSKLTDFNGTIYPTVYDKPSGITSLANDQGSSPFAFTLQKNILFKGKASVVNGDFEFEFIVPKDISYQHGVGKISYYAEDGIRDANGFFEGFLIGGYDENSTPDNEGPEINLFMNDDIFVFGGITDKNPILLAYLNDESGINTTGNGIGHDITTILDDNSTRVIVMNDYYEADLDNYKSGKVMYPFYDLTEGLHNVRFKVWDVHNNSSEAYLEFFVTDSEELAIKHLLNYPNPFSDRTYFVFEHNQSCEALDIEIQIISMSGLTVKTINETINTSGFKTEPIEWNGCNDYGEPIGKGVYIYRLLVKTEDGRIAEKTEKLIILK
ncbi:MAG: type IX secretion system sortase PorU [Bacteroidales bacterium]|nr:type IX secretion system sortase PorU [Bacteroidales bacterium]